MQVVAERVMVLLPLMGIMHVEEVAQLFVEIAVKDHVLLVALDALLVVV